MKIHLFLWTEDNKPKCQMFAFQDNESLFSHKLSVMEQFYDEKDWDVGDPLLDLSKQLDLENFMNEVYKIWKDVKRLQHTEHLSYTIDDK